MISDLNRQILYLNRALVKNIDRDIQKPNFNAVKGLNFNAINLQFCGGVRNIFWDFGEGLVSAIHDAVCAHTLMGADGGHDAIRRVRTLHS